MHAHACIHTITQILCNTAIELEEAITVDREIIVVKKVSLVARMAKIKHLQYKIEARWRKIRISPELAAHKLIMPQCRDIPGIHAGILCTALPA